MSDQIFWYITRSSALMAWLASSVSLLIGLLTSSRLLGRRPTIPWLTDVHRYLSGMSLVFLIVHMVSLWADDFVSLSPAELLIPWVAEIGGLSRTGLALGVIGAWLLALIHVSSLLKDRIPPSVWRTVHLTSFGTLIAGTVHAVQAGSDIDNPLVAAVGLSLLTAIFLATAVRVVRVSRRRASAVTTAITTGPIGEPAGGPPDLLIADPAADLFLAPPIGEQPAPIPEQPYSNPDPYPRLGPPPEIGDTGSTRVVEGGW